MGQSQGASPYIPANREIDVKALVYERNIARFAATKIVGLVANPRAALSPLRILEKDAPELPGEDWVRFYPKLSGICGSDLATITSNSSRYLEDFVSFPFVMGHEVLGEYLAADGSMQRAVLIPSLNCEVRGTEPKCRFCESGHPQRCQLLNIGTISTGLQTGYCQDTSGGWSQELVAHRAQLFDIPKTFSDEDAVLLEPFSCAVHAAMSIGNNLNTQVAVIGSGTLGLLTIAALRAIHPNAEIIATAKYPHQKELALQFGATTVSAANELYRQARAIRSAQMIASDKPTDGFGIVFDAVGSSSTIEQALKVAAPGADVILVGMPKEQKIDLTPLWMKEISIKGSYAYGTETLESEKVSTFELAARFAPGIGLSKLLSATYRLDDFEKAIDHALNAGRRGSVKIAFDMRKGQNRESWSQKQ